MPNGRKNNGWTPHDLRRWGIALLYETGASTRDVMEFVGHATAEAHQRYLHAEPARLRFLAEEISSTAILDAEILVKSKGTKRNKINDINNLQTTPPNRKVVGSSPTGDTFLFWWT